MVDFYGSVAGFETYLTARNHDQGTHSNTEIEAALLVASEWLDARYRSSFSGFKIEQRAQVREWPRSGAIDVYGYAVSAESIPVEVENATYEAARRELASSGSLSVDFLPNKYKSAQVDGAVNVQYRIFDNASEAQTRLQIVDEILAPILTGRGMGSGVTGYAMRG
jgi:hypothetical protein